MSEPDAGLEVAGALAGGSKVVAGEIEGELAGTTGDRIAIDPTLGDTAGAAAQAQTETGESVVAEQALVDTGGQVELGDGLLGELHGTFLSGLGTTGV